MNVCKTEKGRVDKAAYQERSRAFEAVASQAGTSRCYESCSHRVKNRGQFRPRKKGHDDSGIYKEVCANCSEPRYYPKNQVPTLFNVQHNKMKLSMRC